MRKHWKLKKPVAVVTSIALAFSLAVAPGVASARVAQDGLTVGSTAISDVPEWAVDDGSNASALTAQSALPSSYDLRSDGLVTPVKNQSPWSVCWAFAGIAAAETSMLSATGFRADESPTDLSERHLAYFALNPVTEVDDPVQAGEGMHTVSTDRNAAFAAGGSPVYITTLFSQGVGPQAEAAFPYRGVDAQGKSRLNTQALESDPEGVTLTMLASTWHMTEDEAKEKLEEDAAAKGKTYEDALEFYREQLKENYEKAPAYFELDDWSIPATDGSGNSNRTLTPFMTLRDGNVLPEYQNADNTPNPQSIAAMKQELVNGHGVSIAYTADTARPGQSADTRYINRETWAQYTFENEQISHAVCIVGYDDDYPASNFTHDVLTRETDANGNWVKDANDSYVLAKDANGQPYVDLAATEASTPPGNGAWIVKNSWGSETDQATDDLGNVIGTGSYGVRDADGKATGYFYLSYYDKTISQPETMTFSPDLLDDANGFEVLQHDYMAAQGDFYTTPTTTDVTSSANVFETSQDLSIKAVSTRTSVANQRVTFAIYELNDGATEPTDGKLLYRTSRNFEYAGFHRLDLDWPLDVKAGKKIAVVSTASTLDNNGTRLYSASANQALSKQSVEFLREMRKPVPLYGEAVVNEGESFLYSNGQWVDWSKHIASLPSVSGVPIPGVTLPGETYTEQFPIDNFSIKLYAVPADNELDAAKAAQKAAEDRATAAEKDAAAAKAASKKDISAAKVTVAAAKYKGGNAVKPKVTVTLGKTELKASRDYTVSYVNNKKAGSAVAVVKGKGSYTGSAAKAFTIAKAANTMKAAPKAKVNKVKLSKLKKKTQVIAKAKAFKVTTAKGKVTFKKAKGNKKIAVSKAGKVTVKKGLKKGTYKVKVKVTAAGNANYKKATKTVTLKVKVA